MASDARYRTKVFLDTYWTNTNAVDDRGDALGVVSMFAYPEYPLEEEFNGPSNVDVVIAIDQPETEPLMDPVTKAPYAYEESVPLEIIIADKKHVTAIKAIWEAEEEMRLVLESHPSGSKRSVKRVTPNTRRLGSTTLWSAKYVWNYIRGVDV